MTNSSEGTALPTTLPSPELVETAARVAFAEHVRLYDERDEVIVHAESDHLRFIYLSTRASRQCSCATFIQCRVDEGGRAMWINSLQVTDILRKLGLGREMVAAAEATAQAIGMSTVKVYPLQNAAGFWGSLGYTPDSRSARVLQKRMM